MAEETEVTTPPDQGGEPGEIRTPGPKFSETAPTETVGESTGEAVQTVPYSRFYDVNEKRKQAEQAAKEALENQAKIQEQLAQLEQQNKEARLSQARFQAALEAGLDPSWVDRLQGSDYESIREDAMLLAETVKRSAPSLPAPAVTPTVAPAISEENLANPEWIRNNLDTYIRYVNGQK